MDRDSDRADKAAIRKVINAWDHGWRNGDAPALAALFTESAALLPQDQPPVQGRAAIQALYQSVFDECSVEGAGEVLELEVAGNWAFFRSTYLVTAVVKTGGEPMEDRGKWVSILKRQPDGCWKISTLISNSDLPASGS